MFRTTGVGVFLVESFPDARRPRYKGGGLRVSRVARQIRPAVPLDSQLLRVGKQTGLAGFFRKYETNPFDFTQKNVKMYMIFCLFEVGFFAFFSPAG